MLVMMTGFAPKGIIGIAYDSGGVTTSTITVPLVTALGIGLATAIRARNPVHFQLILAFAEDSNINAIMDAAPKTGATGQQQFIAHGVKG